MHFQTKEDLVKRKIQKDHNSREHILLIQPTTDFIHS